MIKVKEKYRTISNGTIIIRKETSTHYVSEASNKHHNESGPAIQYDDGSFEYMIDGKRHRTDGPAVQLNFIFNKSEHQIIAWWYKGKRFYPNSLQEFQKLIKLIAFI